MQIILRGNNLNLSKYSTIPTPAFAVHEPSDNWFSISLSRILSSRPMNSVDLRLDDYFEAQYLHSVRYELSNGVRLLDIYYLTG